MAMNIKKNDKVIVIAGSSKGKSGTVVRVLPSEGKVVVSGVNVCKLHEKPSRTNQAGGIVEKELPINASNVMVVDPKTGKRTRVKRERLAATSKQSSRRVSVKSASALD